MTTKTHAKTNAGLKILGQHWSWLQIIVHLLCIVPALVLVWDYNNNNLGANPIQELTIRTGKAALILLMLTLLCTPLNIMFGLKRVQILRRPLGLYSFFYAVLHLLVFLVVDYRLNFEFISADVANKRYIFVGLAAFLLLLPLAITSTKGWQRRLGKSWRKLHRAIYLAIVLVIIHFAWSLKADIAQPLFYGSVVFVLLVLRLPAIKQWFTSRRKRKA